MDDQHQPTRDTPWVRVRDQFGNEMDRHYFKDTAIRSEDNPDGEYVIIENYPPNLTGQPRPSKVRTEKDGTPPYDAKGAELADRLEKAGLTEATSGLTADEKRAALTEHDATVTDSQEG